MKLRHLLFGLLAGVAFVACTNDNEPAGVSPVNGGDKVATAPKYMKVNFVMPGATTRADDDAEGTKEESAITSAAFLFFKNGAQVADPFVINAGEPDAVSDGIEGKDDSWDPTDQAPDNAVVVLENPSDIPTSMVVLVNADLKVITGKDYKEGGSISDEQKDALKTKTIANLQAPAVFETPTAKGPFTMTNAVYNDASNTTVIGTPVAADNVCESPADARSNPVQVNVERVVAKVNVTNGATAEGAITSGVKDVKIALKGWALVYENTQSDLIKNLATSYPDLPTAFKWNDAANKRSYWATPASYKTTTVKDAQGNEFVTGPTYKGIAEGFTKNVYTQENTVSALKGFAEPTMNEQGKLVYPNENPTAVIVTAQLQDKNGAPLDVYRWANTLLADDDIQTLLKNRAVKKFYKLVDGAYIPVTAGDFTVTTDANIGFDYQVYKYLETELTTLYYNVVKKEDGTVTAEKYEDDDVKTALKDLGELVEYFNGGATYYYVPIKQHSKVDGVEGDADVFGVVRNNFYKLTITSVNGLGTAVPDQGKPIIPDTPDDKDKKYYIAAEIQVLNWNLVEQNVKLGE